VKHCTAIFTFSRTAPYAVLILLIFLRPNPEDL